MSKLSNLDIRQRIILIVSLFVLALVISFTIPRYFVISLTYSLSHRLFLLDKDISAVKKGDYVLFRHKDVATRGIDQTLIKSVKCDEGDDLKVTPEKEFVCNNVYLGKAKDKALNGTTLTYFKWNGIIPKGYFLPMGDHKDSYDGRYYGFIAKNEIIKKATPVF